LADFFGFGVGSSPSSSLGDAACAGLGAGFALTTGLGVVTITGGNSTSAAAVAGGGDAACCAVTRVAVKARGSPRLR
jgi:hypothetical protein